MIDIVRQDRGTALRKGSVFVRANAAEAGRQFNIEFRVCDAAARPYLALGAVMFAGVDGLRRELKLPRPSNKPHALPHTLGAPLNTMEASNAVRGWFGSEFREAYLRHKRSEVAHTESFAATESWERCAEIY